MRCWRRLVWLLAAWLLAGCATRLPAPAAPSAIALMRDDPGRLIVVAVNSRPELAPAGVGTSAAYGGTRLYAAGSAARATLDTLARDYQLREVAGWPIEALGLYCVVVETANAAQADEALQRLRRDGRVALAQPLNTFETLSAEGYNDPYLHRPRARLRPTARLAR